MTKGREAGTGAAPCNSYPRHRRASGSAAAIRSAEATECRSAGPYQMGPANRRAEDFLPASRRDAPPRAAAATAAGHVEGRGLCRRGRPRTAATTRPPRQDRYEKAASLTLLLGGLARVR